MTYYSVLDVTPTSEDWIPAYIGPTNASIFSERTCRWE